MRVAHGRTGFLNDLSAVKLQRFLRLLLLNNRLHPKDRHFALPFLRLRLFKGYVEIVENRIGDCLAL